MRNQKAAMTDKMTTVLRVDSSARRAGSVIRELTDLVIETLDAATVVIRDLATAPVPQVDAEWVAATSRPRPSAAARRPSGWRFRTR
jgi:FMN-dependent NADH-azoreductase